MEALTINDVLRNGVKNAGVLCVIDLSEASRETLNAAVLVADRLKATLSVLYPYRLNGIDKIENMSQVKKNIDLAAHEKFKKISEGYLKNSGVTYQFHPEVGFVNDRIESWLRRGEPGLIIIGQKQVINNKEGFVELIDRLTVPLLIVPQNKPTNS